MRPISVHCQNEATCVVPGPQACRQQAYHRRHRCGGHPPAATAPQVNAFGENTRRCATSRLCEHALRRQDDGRQRALHLVVIGDDDDLRQSAPLLPFAGRQPRRLRRTQPLSSFEDDRSRPRRRQQADARLVQIQMYHSLAPGRSLLQHEHPAPERRRLVTIWGAGSRMGSGGRRGSQIDENRGGKRDRLLDPMSLRLWLAGEHFGVQIPVPFSEPRVANPEPTLCKLRVRRPRSRLGPANVDG